MGRIGFVKYCSEEFGFMNRENLIYSGYHPCLVRDRGYYRGLKGRNSAKHYLLIETEDGRFSGKILVSAGQYNKYKKNCAYKPLSIVTNSRGHVRFSEDPDPEKTIGQVSKTAKKIVVQMVIGFAAILLSIAALLLPLYSH